MSAENSVTVSLGALLRNEWEPSNTAGYDPLANEGDSNFLDVHLGWYDEDKSFPQLALNDVSAPAMGSNGYVGWNADGSGPIQGFRPRIDVVAFVGSVDHVDETPALLAKDLGDEVRRIVHGNAQALTDAVTGDQLCDHLAALSKPVVSVNANADPSRYSSRVEVQARIYEQPP